MIRVLVVDDEDLIRLGLAALLRTAPDRFEVLDAADGAEAVAVAATAQPDVILMDIKMPGMDGITAIGEILAQAGDSPPAIIVLTLFDLDEYVRAALAAGAIGYLLKSGPSDHLFAAVEAAAAGHPAFAPDIGRRIIEAYVHPAPPGQGDRSASHEASSGDGEATAEAPAAADDNLTARERETLRLIAQGLTNTEAAKELGVSEATVKSHLYRAMHKIGAESRAQAVTYAYQSGLVRPPDSSAGR